MQFTTIAAALPALAATAATALTVAYDGGYDIASRSIGELACSDGQYGLTTRYGWTEQGQASGFPHIGAAEAVTGWNSPGCGTCWTLTWEGRSVTILAVDKADAGFNIALDAMNDLTNGQAVALGRIEADAVQVDGSVCGLPPTTA